MLCRFFSLSLFHCIVRMSTRFIFLLSSFFLLFQYYCTSPFVHLSSSILPVLFIVLILSSPLKTKGIISSFLVSSLKRCSLTSPFSPSSLLLPSSSTCRFRVCSGGSSNSVGVLCLGGGRIPLVVPWLLKVVVLLLLARSSSPLSS